MLAMPIPSTDTQTPDLATTIRRASTLQKDIARLTEQLEAAKAEIRKAAARYALSAHNSPVQLECSIGSCSIAYVSDRLEIVGKVDPAIVRDSLPPSLHRLFTTRVVLRPDAGDIVLSLPRAQRAQLSGMVEFRAQSPRVTLPRIA
jgi:hypothetical protein